MLRRNKLAAVVAFVGVLAIGAKAEVVNGIDEEGSVAIPNVAESLPSPSEAELVTALPGATVIDFDDSPAPCRSNETTPLRDQFAELGVVLEMSRENSGGAILHECSNFDVSGHSLPNFLAFYRYRDPATFLFDPPVSLVRIIAGGETDRGSVLAMEAFGPNGENVDTDSMILAPEMQPLSVTGETITEVLLTGYRFHVVDDLTFVTAVVDTEVDVKPWSDPNVINPFSRPTIPVAILGSDDLDVLDVDVTTLAFGPNGASPAFDLTNPWVLLFSRWDLNGDGKLDLLSHYRTEDTGIPLGVSDACLTGETVDGEPFKGCDAVITMIGCGLGFELVFVLPPLIWLRRRLRS